MEMATFVDVIGGSGLYRVGPRSDYRQLWVDVWTNEASSERTGVHRISSSRQYFLFPPYFLSSAVFLSPFPSFLTYKWGFSNWSDDADQRRTIFLGKTVRVYIVVH